MKLLHIIATVDPQYGGPVEGILRQSEVMEGTREIASLDPEDASFLARMPVKTYALGDYKTGQGWGRFTKRYGVSRKYLRWLRNNVHNYDCVIVNGIWNFTTLAASLTLPRSNVPYFVFTHGMLDPWFRRNFPAKHMLKQLFWLLCENRLLARAEAVLFTTVEERDLARTMFWGRRYREEVVGYGTGDPPFSEVQEKKFRELLPALGDRKFLLFLSRIHLKKGCDLLIEAFGTLAGAYPDIDLVIAGPDESGLQARLQQRSELLGISKRVHWPGMISGDAKWGAFRSAEAFVLPSHSENFGIVVAEALACGTPVLISNKVNIWREIDNDEAGIVDEDTVQGALTMIDKFLSLTSDDRLRMETSARECFLKNFEVSQRVAAFQGLLKEAISKKGHRHD
ncbi:glycosyltransferase involved in cell wall biosynthesis [Bradyrhizobium sp. LM6.10]